MSCIKSFFFTSSANETVSAPNIDTWGLAPQNYWLAQSSAGTSTFNIQGFKNVNIHGIEAVGDVSCLLNTGFSAIVKDWAFFIQINGQSPLISGNITASPNRFSIITQATNAQFGLSRYNPRLYLADPITSATSIQVTGYRVSGIGAESLTVINVAWNINYIVYYSYEGE